MRLVKYLIVIIVAIAPIAAIASLVTLGGWGWMLFLWFGFTGMFSLGVVKMHDEERRNAPAIIGLSTILLLAFVGGATFALSDLPDRVSFLYGAFAPFLLIPILVIRERFKKRPKPRESTALKVFAKQIESWPRDQARTALLLVRATVSGDSAMIEKLYPELTVSQLRSVQDVLRKMEAGEA